MTGNEPRTSFDVITRRLLEADRETLLADGPFWGDLIPELGATLGFDQRSPHHAYDLYTHIVHVTAKMPPMPELRWAALLHDVGKLPTFTQDETGRGHFYGHAGASAEMADAILSRLEAPEELRSRAVLLIRLHMAKLIPEKEALAPWLAKLGSETLEQLLLLQEADMSSKGVESPAEMAQFPALRAVLKEIG